VIILLFWRNCSSKKHRAFDVECKQALVHNEGIDKNHRSTLPGKRVGLGTLGSSSFPDCLLHRQTATCTSTASTERTAESAASSSNTGEKEHEEKLPELLFDERRLERCQLYRFLAFCPRAHNRKRRLCRRQRLRAQLRLVLHRHFNHSAFLRHCHRCHRLRSRFRRTRRR
jgi:hypothetical protein